MGTSGAAERIALVALLQNRPGAVRWSDLVADVTESGSAVQVWHRLNDGALIARPGEPDPLETASADVDRWGTEGFDFVTILDDGYPARLRGVHEAPPIVFFRGTLRRDDSAVSVVGSRKASERGLRLADGIARALVACELTVVAGLAAGIDTAAHRAALDAGGRTVAVIGTGIRRVYPSTNRALHEEIAERGLLLSQFWPDAPPQKHTFLMRNATMSGYGLATVVVEAGEQSGARVQARMAVGHGRPVILTELVVATNDWAKALVGRPDVHIAADRDDVVGIVQDLLRRPEVLDEALRGLTSA